MFVFARFIVERLHTGKAFSRNLYVHVDYVLHIEALIFLSENEKNTQLSKRLQKSFRKLIKKIKTRKEISNLGCIG